MGDERFKDLKRSIEEAGAHLCGELDLSAGNIHFMSEPDPREICGRLGLTREDFVHS